ncbi:hypothetical protein, partial [Methylobacterium indicum]
MPFARDGDSVAGGASTISATGRPDDRRPRPSLRAPAAPEAGDVSVGSSSPRGAQGYPGNFRAETSTGFSSPGLRGDEKLPSDLSPDGSAWAGRHG